MSNDRKDNIVKRIYIHGSVKLVSPLIVGSGENDNTDTDILRDSKGEPYIPGTAIAGVFRNYSNKKSRFIKEDKEISLLFGNQMNQGDDNSNNLMSSIIFSDANINKAVIDNRDGVRLEYKTSVNESKFDYEIVEAGANFPIKIEIVIREKHKNELNTINEYVYKILTGLIDEKISIGRKSNRGFGKVKLIKETLKILTLDFENKVDKEAIFESWLNFNWENFKGNTDLLYFKPSNLNLFDNTISIDVSFDVKSSLIIRRYSKNIDDVDYEHIQSNNKSIIPGTTWAGAIKNHIKNLIISDYEDNSKLINQIEIAFGYISKDKKSYSSLVKIGESVINENKLFTQRRVKIDRFTGGAVQSALYNEKPSYFGKLDLKIEVVKNDEIDEDILIALIIIAIKDISNGILPIGGETSIGRGILEITKESDIKINGEIMKENLESKYMKSLASFLMDGGSN